jgi:toxin ParE1/3/4
VARLRFLDQAKDDLVAIAVYIARASGSPELALRFTRRLRAKCAELARQPFTMGRPRPELGQDLRSYAFGRYVIFFRYRGETMEVVTILEGHRDIEAVFGEEGG